MVKSTLYFDELDTPIGPLSLLGDDDKLLRIDFGHVYQIEEKWQKWLNRYFKEASLTPNSKPFQTAKDELSAYFNGEEREFSLNYETWGTAFQKQVWQALIYDIPFGETKSYKDIAEIIDNPKAVRAVGGAVNKNPISIVVPCHRVIGANGKMVGYGGGLDKKEFLLAFEKENNNAN